MELLRFHRVVKVQCQFPGRLLSLGCEMGLGRVAQVLFLDVTVFECEVFDSMTS